MSEVKGVWLDESAVVDEAALQNLTAVKSDWRSDGRMSDSQFRYFSALLKHSVARLNEALQALEKAGVGLHISVTKDGVQISPNIGDERST